MTNNDPTTWPLTTWLLTVLLAVGGGFVRWFWRYKRSRVKTFNLFEFVGDLVSSGTIGVFAAIFAAQIDPSVGAIGLCAGVAGHMGARFLFLLSRNLESKLGVDNKE